MRIVADAAFDWAAPNSILNVSPSCMIVGHVLWLYPAPSYMLLAATVAVIEHVTSTLFPNWLYIVPVIVALMSGSAVPAKSIHRSPSGTVKLIVVPLTVKLPHPVTVSSSISHRLYIVSNDGCK